MEDIRQQVDTDVIRQSLATETYFRQSRQWYDELYHRPIAERTYFLVITVMSVLTIFFSAITYFSMLPLVRTVPYTLYTKDISEELPIITPLRAEPAEDVNISVARFLISNYIQERESYRYDVVKLEWQFNRIRGTSDKEEFARYQEQINPENPGSPFNKYGRSFTRSLYQQSIQLRLNAEESSATAYFTTSVYNGKTREQNRWVANITFRFPELTVNQETNEVMQWNPEKNMFEVAETIDFRVKDYSVQEITQ